MSSIPHPFDPLSPEEISRVCIRLHRRYCSALLTEVQAADIVRPGFPGQDPNFRVITLKEPPKAQMIEFLEKEHRKQPTSSIPARCARVQVVISPNGKPNRLFELEVDLDGNKVSKQTELHGKHSHIDPEYMQEVEAVCMADERVKHEIKQLDLPAGSQVIIEPWAYATDGMNDMTQRVTMVCLLITSTQPAANPDLVLVLSSGS